MMTRPVLQAGAWPAVAGISGVAVVVGGCGAAFPAAATMLLPICFALLAAAAAFTLDEPASLVVDVTPTGPVRRTRIRAVALLAPLTAGALVMLTAALRGLSLPWAATGLALAGNVLLGFAAACVARTRTGEPGTTAGAAVVLVLMAPSLVPQAARWVRTFPAPGASGLSSDTLWWIVLAVCVAAIAISIGGRKLPQWMPRLPYPWLHPGPGRGHNFRPGRDHPAASVKLTDAPASAAEADDPGQLKYAAPARRPAVQVIAALWAATVLAAMAGAVLTVVARDNLASGDLASQLAIAVSIASYATLGALIVRRAGNVIGWIMLAAGAAQAFLALASIYGVIGVATFPGSLPAARQVGTLAECSFPAVVFTVAFTFLLFPTGTLPSRRWRPVAAAGLVLAVLTTAGLVVHPRLVALIAPGGASLSYPNPLAVSDLGPVAGTVLVGTLNGLSAVFLPFLAAAFVSLAVRYRAGGRLLRQQIKWLALTAVGFLACMLAALLGLADGQAWLTTAAYTALQLLALFGIPAAMTFAILVRRLYDIDVIISRAVVYGLLSAAVTGVYASIVLGIGTFVGHRRGPVLTIAAAVTIALLFQPLRRRAQLFSNRLVYGTRATPYQALSDFAGSMAGQLDLTEAVERMVSVLAGATGADRAEAWIRVGPELRPAAIWPSGSPLPAAVTTGAGGGIPPFTGASRAVAVTHGGELLGALSLHKPPNEPLTSTEDELMRHLASQAGLVVRNAALTAQLQATIDELRASRRRLVEAQDAERRKIERNLHDGAQQQLIALTIHLAMLEESAGDPAAVRELASAVKEGVRAALDDLRDLARGIYPPLLADQGLVPALQAQARKASLPVRIDADGIGRYPQDTEAAVYFCTLEALQNVAKYANASRATVGLSCSGDSLQFTVTDDGTGFDTTTVPPGTGLQGMADRLAALGGALHIRSQPGDGTILSGELPLTTSGQGLRE